MQMPNTFDENLEPAVSLWVGLDVSRDTLDACLLRPNNKSTHKQFDNDANGFAKLLRWVQHAAPEQIAHFCLEATGAYSQAVALFLAEAGQLVSVVNPARIRFFGLAQAQGNKTDKADAALIARFCRQEAPDPWRVAAPEVRELVALIRRLHAVQELAVQEKNRLSVPSQRALSACRRCRVAAKHTGVSRSRDQTLARADSRAHQRPSRLEARLPIAAKHSRHR